MVEMKYFIITNKKSMTSIITFNQILTKGPNQYKKEK